MFGLLFMEPELEEKLKRINEMNERFMKACETLPSSNNKEHSFSKTE